MENLKKLFVARLKEARSAANVSTGSIAESLGIRPRSVYNWESTGRSHLPSHENLIKLSNLLGCSIDYLLGQTDNPERNL
ncbi:MAG: helix-turn-helix domain-containing protein [Firmicutes bacterium]|nr:helix-turn-helix domain-containing protein [Bacillota bacterium]